MKQVVKTGKPRIGTLSPLVHQTLIADFQSVLKRLISNPSPNYYNSLDLEFKIRYLQDELLSKLNIPEVSAQDRRQAAIDKWLNVDFRNAKTNQRLCWSSSELSTRRGIVTTDEVLERAASIINRVIGKEPPLDILSKGLFSNGASTRIRRVPDSIARKYVGKADVTQSCWSHFITEAITNQAWVNLNDDCLKPNIVRGNVMFTVPKSPHIDRVACKEPEINMLAQKSVGNYIRFKLNRFGISLNDQRRNQWLAFAGSESRKLATIDLSSASDSISSMLVSRLLPPGWFVLLDAIRSQETEIDGVWYRPSMFSSMGNGFTFELESLIFWALARSTMYYTGTRGSLSVYGDDIIIPGSVAAFFINVLGFCGFKTNVKKTHFRASDPFRESCGSHFYDGRDVTPFYIREPINHVTRVIHFLNHVITWAEDVPDEQLALFWRRWALLVPYGLHGGKDPSAIDSLYTPDRPRQRLVKAKKKVFPDGTGAYLQWLHMRDGYEGDTLETVTSCVSTDKPRWVYRQNTMWHREVHDFLFVLIQQDKQT